MDDTSVSERDSGDRDIEDDPKVARVIVHEVYPHKLEGGRVQVVEPKLDDNGEPVVQTVRRVIADGLVKAGRGELHETDSRSTTQGERKS